MKNYNTHTLFLAHLPASREAEDGRIHANHRRGQKKPRTWDEETTYVK